MFYTENVKGFLISLLCWHLFDELTHHMIGNISTSTSVYIFVTLEILHFISNGVMEADGKQ